MNEKTELNEKMFPNASVSNTVVECVLISDSDTEESETKEDKRRVSRRKKNKVEYSDVGTTPEAQKSTNHAPGITDVKKNFETRGRKEQRSSTPIIAKEADASVNKEVISGLEGAAFQSRLPFDKMTSNEAASFPETTKCGLPAQLVFLNIRNRILQMWIEVRYSVPVIPIRNCSCNCLFFQDPKTQLTHDNALLNIEKPFDSDPLLLRRIHAFLERHGFINFGIFKRLIDIVPSKVPIKVIVIGAGISVSYTKKPSIRQSIYN